MVFQNPQKFPRKWRTYIKLFFIVSSRRSFMRKVSPKEVFDIRRDIWSDHLWTLSKPSKIFLGSSLHIAPKFNCSGWMCQLYFLKQTYIFPIILSNCESTCRATFCKTTARFQITTIFSACRQNSKSVLKIFVADWSKTRLD